MAAQQQAHAAELDHLRAAADAAEAKGIAQRRALVAEVEGLSADLGQLMSEVQSHLGEMGEDVGHLKVRKSVGTGGLGLIKRHTRPSSCVRSATVSHVLGRHLHAPLMHMPRWRSLVNTVACSKHCLPPPSRFTPCAS